MSTPGAVRAWELHFTWYRRYWKANVLGAVVQPLMYMLGMGVGALVDRRATTTGSLGDLTYFQFLAPGLLATTAMMVAAGESLWPTMAGFKWTRQYHAQAASPLSAGHVVGGVTLFHVTRVAVGASGVALAMACFDETRNWGLVAGVVFAIVTALAFTMPLIAWAGTRESEQSFPSIMRFVVTPLFLFGGAFYPIGELPGWLQVFAKLTPLWHGVELCRTSVVGSLGSADTFVHLAVLAAYIVVGAVAARAVFAKRLAK